MGSFETVNIDYLLQTAIYIHQLFFRNLFAIQLRFHTYVKETYLIRNYILTYMPQTVAFLLILSPTMISKFLVGISMLLFKP